MTRILPLLLSLLWLISGHSAAASEFRHIGDYLLKSRTRLTGDKVSPVSIKPMLLHVFTDGVEVRITAENDAEACSIFEIYRSDGIGRQRSAGGALEVIPGIQAFSRNGGTFRHLRLSRESLTITLFPGISDQTLVTHAIAVEITPPPSPATPSSTKPDSVNR
jgi:hypothetical protein